MKLKIIYIVILLLVSCDKGDNNESSIKETKIPVQKETVKKIIYKENKINKTNVIEKTDGADKNRVDKLVENFDENINISLMSEDELKEYVRKAVENLDQLHRGFLLHKLKVNKQYELAVFVASNMVEKSETSREYAGKLYTYASALFDNCNSENDYKTSLQAINSSINEFEKLLEKGEIVEEDDLMFMGSPYQICIGEIIKHKNDLSMALEYLRRYENTMGEYNGVKKDFYIDFGAGEIYNKIAFNINKADNNGNWIYTLKDIEQIKSYANSLSDDELSPMVELLLKGKKFKVKIDPLKKSLLDALKKIENDANSIKNNK